MKNFIISLILATSIVSSVQAAEKIRNLSMSVEETNELLRNPPKQNTNNVNNEGTGFDDSVPLDPNMARQMREINSRNANSNANFLGGGTSGLPSFPIQGNGAVALPSARRGINAQNYINEFCSNNYVPKNTGSTAIDSCQQEQRQQSCERFARATVNVQRILSQTIDCESNSTGFNSPGCDGLDASRLDLLKQYWQDEDMSYTILFLPDMVLNSASNCSSKR